MITDPRVMEAFVQRKYPQLPGPPLVLGGTCPILFTESAGLLGDAGGVQSLLQGR